VITDFGEGVASQWRWLLTSGGLSRPHLYMDSNGHMIVGYSRHERERERRGEFSTDTKLDTSADIAG